MYICSNCNIELENEDLEACELVAVGKLYCQDCLLNIERDIFVDDKGLLTHTWDKYERFVIDGWKQIIMEDDLSYLDYYIKN
tara:strand:+ start:54 stop:299 length:246 start_codon:yes stop_codon:yes gene_type:complete